MARRRAVAPGAHPSHAPGGREHARARPVLPLAAAAGPRRQPGAVRAAARRRAVQRHAGTGVLVDVPGRPAPSRAPGPARPPPPPRRRRLHPDLQRAGRHRRADRDRRHPDARRQGARRHPRRRRPRRDGADGDAPRRALPPAANARRGQGRQHQPRPRPHRRPVRPRPRLRPRAVPRDARAAAARVHRPARGVRAVAAVLRQPRRQPARRRGVEPAGAVLRADRPGQGRPPLDDLLRHQRRVPAGGAR